MFDAEIFSHLRMSLSALLSKGAPIVLLSLLWIWESARPYFGRNEHRIVHAGRNLALALANTVFIGLLFGGGIFAACLWAEKYGLGLLRVISLSDWAQLGVAILMLDAVMYLWHRANHACPFLWKFHRVHHSDEHMDVTTATRFHVGEHIFAMLLRLALIPLLGLEASHLLVYDALLIAVTQFQHADISVGRWDRIIRWVIVTPMVHKVHHSDHRHESDSNYSAVFPIWDRIAGTLLIRHDPENITFGVPELHHAEFQTIAGMLMTPFVHDADVPFDSRPAEASERKKILGLKPIDHRKSA